MDQGSDGDGKVLEMLDFIEGEVDRAEDVISNLLSYGSNREITFSEIQIDDIISDAIAGFVVHETVNLSTETEPNLPSILGDASQLRRLLQNLMINAQDAVQGREQVEGCISIKAGSRDKSLEIVIADNGGGIKQEDLDNIFEPLYTAKSHGTGLGLAICQEIVNRHNGTISVESEIDEGTTFRICIPFTRNEDERAEGSSQA